MGGKSANDGPRGSSSFGGTAGGTTEVARDDGIKNSIESRSWNGSEDVRGGRTNDGYVVTTGAETGEVENFDVAGVVLVSILASACRCWARGNRYGSVANAGSTGEAEAQVSGAIGNASVSSRDESGCTAARRGGTGTRLAVLSSNVNVCEYGCPSSGPRASLRKLSRTTLEVGADSAVRGVLSSSKPNDLANAA